ncbi:MAG: SAM-dependent methyltransferase [Porticoccaceae bacterium]|jgi:S-adenosylmethionine-dependent methyltransferase|nr:SAM-dependent methyltransferase [Porticoccaceae bacterium]|tara:strand:+ start:2109 stop:2885 length:777 start_codon:yes stop_codon:yes gene_type:complete
MKSNAPVDRNFDDLTEKFKRKVYGGLKGEIRLAVIWRDLNQLMALKVMGKPIRILDIGGGLGQLSTKLSLMGHQVSYNDISCSMMIEAQKLAKKNDQLNNIDWHNCPYQDLSPEILGRFDLVMCHAVIEWLAHPDKLIEALTLLKAENGVISLTFYNQNSLIYRNLLKGNFKLLEREFNADPGSLTPHTPFLPESVLLWIKANNLEILKSSGIRVFFDYIASLKGGHLNDVELISKELEYSEIEPFKSLGRYIHYVLR